MFQQLIDRAHALPELNSNGHGHGHNNGCEVWYGNESEQYRVEYDLSGHPIAVQIVGALTVYRKEGDSNSQ